MRLINCWTLTLEDYMGDYTPPYAILSHTWGYGEVTYDDFTKRPLEARKKQGWVKIEKTCEIARKDGCNFAWIDTCCIDKTSSSELSEAINSMFDWYGKSAICYAYLSDLHPNKKGRRKEKHDFRRREIRCTEELKACVWFTRGFTLQELIAPEQLHFYDSKWVYYADRLTMRYVLAGITGIETSILWRPRHDGIYWTCEASLRSCSVAQKMSWAARRKTTRREDVAYCLLGLFGINMPLLYGEGDKAFLRLQEAIVRESSDLTIFAWRRPRPDKTDDEEATGATGDRDRDGKPVGPFAKSTGIFATSPFDFVNSGDIRPHQDIGRIPDFALTNKGLRIDTDLEHYVSSNDEEMTVLNIHCYSPAYSATRLGVRLIRIGQSFAREKAHELITDLHDGWKSVNEAPRGPGQSVYIMKHIDVDTLRKFVPPQHDALYDGLPSRAPFIIRDLHMLQTIAGLEVREAHPLDKWNAHTNSFQGIARGFVGWIFYGFPSQGASLLVACCRSESDGSDWVSVATLHENKDVFTAFRENATTKVELPLRMIYLAKDNEVTLYDFYGGIFRVRVNKDPRDRDTATSRDMNRISCLRGPWGRGEDIVRGDVHELPGDFEFPVRRSPAPAAPKKTNWLTRRSKQPPPAAATPGQTVNWV